MAYRKVSDSMAEAIKRAYLAGEGSYELLSVRFSISPKTVERLAKAGGWRSLKEAQNHTASIVAQAATVAVLDQDLPMDELLLRAIEHLGRQALVSEVRSADSAGVALAKMIQVYRKYRPVTMEEAVDLMFEIGDFEPRKFAQIMKEKWDIRTAR